MKKPFAIAVMIVVLLMVAGFASNKPGPHQPRYAVNDVQERHMKYYEEIRPLLFPNPGALSTLCNDGGR